MSSEIAIDSEIHGLIPPLADEERRQLETNLKSDGCRDPLVTWSGILLDGHNRREICQRLGIGYRTVSLTLHDRNAALAWVIRNQFGRRNLSDFQRAELALKLEPLLAAAGKENQRVAGDKRWSKTAENGKISEEVGFSPENEGDPHYSRNLKLVQNSAQAISSPKTRVEIAKSAGVSHDTIAKVKAVSESGAEPLKALARAGKVSVRAAAKVARLRKEEQAKLAAAGPAAVKAKAKEIREAEPAPVASAGPWGEFERDVRAVMSDLRKASRQLGVVLKADPSTKQLKEKWAHFYSHTGTVGAINAVIRNLETNLPAAEADKPPGFLPLRVVNSREALAGKEE